MKPNSILTAAACLFALAATAQDTARVEVIFTNRLGPLNISQMALGQGGLSDDPMWDSRVAEVRALRPRVIRLFVQEYFDLLPKRGRFHFDTLDRSVDNILKTGAEPLMCLCFKPRILFPEINQDVVEPTDYTQWENLIFLASVHSPLLPALLDAARTNRTPLHFVSWHIYTSAPGAVRKTIEYAKDLLRKYPALRPETILDEWNMDLTNPALDPRFQPCFVAETIWQMKDSGLDYSCYYHIRDWFVEKDMFAPFFSPHGAAFMARWWNRMPQFDGLFDYQNNVRPAYFTLKLLSRLQGERLPLSSSHAAVHGFATHDEQMRMDNLVLWNFSTDIVPVELSLLGLTRDMRTRHIILDAQTTSNDENARLRPEPFATFSKGDHHLELKFEPYAVHYWSFE